MQSPIEVTHIKNRCAGPGTAVFAHIGHGTFHHLLDYVWENNIPKYIKPPFGKMHLTMLLHPVYHNLQNVRYNEPVVIRSNEMKLQVHAHRGKNLLALHFTNELLFERMKYLHAKTNKIVASTPHITLSYNVGERFQIPKMKKFDIVIDGEYIEGIQDRLEGREHRTPREISEININRAWRNRRRSSNGE